MKKYNYILASIVITFMLSACGGGSPSPKYAVFGDSTTYGAAPHSPPYDCIARINPTWVETAASVSGIDLINEGRNGTILSQLEDGDDSDRSCNGNPPAHLPLKQWIAAHPEITAYVFVYGINEAAGLQIPDYTNVIELVKAAGRQVILVEPFYVTANPLIPSLPADFTQRVIDVRRSLYRYGVPVVSISHLDAVADVPDGLHPSQQYADILGREIGSQLAALRR